MLWKEWAGYHAVRCYDTVLEPEYQAIRSTAGLLDVTPLYKYEVQGPDAAAFLSWLTVRRIEALKVGRMTYLCWCDDDGKVVDDGTVAHLDTHHFRVTAAEPAYAWLLRHAERFEVTLEDSSQRLGALALQGPLARRILAACCDDDLAALRYFGVTTTRLAGNSVWVSRTGYTGDLGYEIWVPAERALAVWDALVEAGEPWHLRPVGLDALDMCRIEAGYIMNGVDYFSAHQCLIESRKSSPFEIGLDWTVQLDRSPFIGQAALRREKEAGSAWVFAGLVYDWEDYEALHARFGLPPRVPAGAWRAPVPVYDDRGRQVGYASSGTWSPLLKKNLALASLRSSHGAPGTRLHVEVTVEFQRHRVGATVTRLPFFDPERKRAVGTLAPPLRHAQESRLT